MADEGFKRKLTAILSADVAGYSRLMGENEAGTVKTLTTYQKIMGDLIQQHHGRTIDSPGDNILAEFASVVDAVQCGVIIQKELEVRNTDLPENRKMRFRIGINLGDVIEESGRIYGDGVNIAARLESLADPGGISISSSVYEQLEGKINLEFNYQGEQRVKNIARPIRIYRVLMEPLSIYPEAAHKSILETMPFALLDKPSIAVLPFVNMSADPTQEYIADGISENIIMVLSKIPQMLVIARNSTFTYKNKAVKVQDVARDLDVRYVLEGSVQKGGDRLRITAQLIDANSGNHIWAERYDRELNDLFALQDEIALSIAVALQVEMTDGEQARVRQKSTNNLEAWSYFVKAYDLFQHHTKEDNAKARQLLDEALKLDSNFSVALTLKAVTHFQDARFGYSRSRAESFMNAARLCQEAMVLNDSDPDTLALWGIIENARGNYDRASESGEKALAMGPNNAEVHAMLAVIKYYAEDYPRAITLLKKALRLHPHYPAWYSLFLGKALTEAKQYGAALDAFRDVIARAPYQHWGYSGSAIVWVRLGNKEKAKDEISKALKINPELTLEFFRDGVGFYKNPETLKQILKDLREAGLKGSGS